MGIPGTASTSTLTHRQPDPLQLMRPTVQNKYMVRWFSNRVSENPKLFYRQTRTDEMRITNSELVHHFDKLTGGRKDKGRIPARAMKVIEQAVAAGKDAVSNDEGLCPGCRKDVDDACSENVLQCSLCRDLYHKGCSGCNDDDADEFWLCKECDAMANQYPGARDRLR